MGAKAVVHLIWTAECKAVLLPKRLRIRDRRRQRIGPTGRSRYSLRNGNRSKWRIGKMHKEGGKSGSMNASSDVADALKLRHALHL